MGYNETPTPKGPEMKPSDNKTAEDTTITAADLHQGAIDFEDEIREARSAENKFNAEQRAKFLKKIKTRRVVAIGCTMAAVTLMIAAVQNASKNQNATEEDLNEE